MCGSNTRAGSDAGPLMRFSDRLRWGLGATLAAQAEDIEHFGILGVLAKAQRVYFNFQRSFELRASAKEFR